MHTPWWPGSCASKIEAVTLPSSVILSYRALSVSASLSDIMDLAVVGCARRNKGFLSNSFLRGMASWGDPSLNLSLEKGPELVSAGERNALSAKSELSRFT